MGRVSLSRGLAFLKNQQRTVHVRQKDHHIV